MKNKIKFFLISFFLTFINFNVNAENNLINPEPYISKSSKNFKSLKTEDFIVVTANDYATKIGYEILNKGGNVYDAAVAIQMTLGLVEPQSSGLGGGTFITTFNNKLNKVLSYNGRETAPMKIPENVFLDKNSMPKAFYSAAIGGLSVGVPGTIKVFHQLHKDFGKLEWNEILKPVIKLAKSGFYPPPRLIAALKKEKFLFANDPNSIFGEIIKFPKKKFQNFSYAKTLETISEDYSIFYEGQIAKDIIKVVKNHKNPGYLNMKDLKNYKIKKRDALCHRLRNGYLLCGPNLPSSGTICVLQALNLYEFFINNDKSILKNHNKNLQLKLSILNFVYSIRDNQLGDSEFENFNINKLLNIQYLLPLYKTFNENALKLNLGNLDQILDSTSHFSLVDKYKNIISVTSSIESGFGSRLYTNGFFLNNQLTDFSFRLKNSEGKSHRNRPQGNKRPLSSMTPIIVLDKNDNFYLTIGSPGGKAIIAYVFKVLSDVFYSSTNLKKIVESPNFLKINGKIFFEKKELNKISSEKGNIRNLTSGLAVIRKESKFYEGVADSRRDGSVRGE